MGKVFLKWGRVIDVYKPPRRDEEGKKFGFVKFMDVQNPKALKHQIEGIMIGDRRLKVNIPKYDKNHTRENKVLPHKNFVEQARDDFLRNGVSFARAVNQGTLNVNNYQNGDGRIFRSNRVQNQQINEWNGLVFNVAEEDTTWLKGCYVAQTFNPE